MKNEKKETKSNNVVNMIKKNKLYIIIVLIVIVITFCSIFAINTFLSKNEKIIYDIVYKNKNTFKNPESLKVVEAKVCNKDYSIIRITANNSFGAETTETYYFNKNTLTNADAVAKAVIKKCFDEEISNYDDVIALSSKSIKKINNKLGGNK